MKMMGVGGRHHLKGARRENTRAHERLGLFQVSTKQGGKSLNLWDVE